MIRSATDPLEHISLIHQGAFPSNSDISYTCIAGNHSILLWDVVISTPPPPDQLQHCLSPFHRGVLPSNTLWCMHTPPPSDLGSTPPYSSRKSSHLTRDVSFPNLNLIRKTQFHWGEHISLQQQEVNSCRPNLECVNSPIHLIMYNPGAKVCPEGGVRGS